MTPHPPILFEDAEALVIDKPGGLPIERPRRGGAALEDHYDALRLGFARAPVPVHRLDTDTSGCLLLARHPRALARFARAFAERRVDKTYVGILAGTLAGEEGTIALALAKISSAGKGWRMIAARRGKPALTHWERLATAGGLSLVRFRPVTGRTHQIRVHAAEGLGLPLLGDPVYGAPDPRTGRTMLHAEQLALPRAGKPGIEAKAPWPPDFARFGFAESG
ncbi:RNA pseudouridine synthase [Erythrobacteraceae bacterium CFH 75059]|uniref:RluA family pseudouridine synthase n=1 Tax=Qipengyuania thermophila TaxID=2509361 RepID=UPI00101F26F1|nr:RNA pseudouridine synthase [Qipengyuania thermophila]TCD06523.1 RNA pseudouridine synthase [Erythrobacteraceae bacterium CFH 75059]